MDQQLKQLFPIVKTGQRCHYQANGGFINGHVSQSFDGGFVVTLEDGQAVRFLRDKWDESDAESLLWLTRNGKPMMRRWFTR